MRKLSYKPLLFILFWLMITAGANAQRVNIIDSIANKINLYGIKNQAPVLFIHFDKNVYSNNENVWFTAYLFNADYSLYNTLSLALVKDDGRSVVMEDKFVMNAGLSFDNTNIADTVAPGNYTFIASTNRLVNGKPNVVFTQPLTIRSEDRQGYTASLNPLDTSANAIDKKVLLLVNFAATNPREIPVAVPASWYVGNIAHPVLKGQVKTAAGQYIFNIPSRLLSPGNNRLHVQVSYKKEVKNITMELPVPPGPAVIGFYPEGGNLVNNIQSTVGFEVKSVAGTPIGLSALLYENDKIIDTIETNSYGLGSFKLTPVANSNYYVKLYGLNKKDTLYKLPVALRHGPTLSIANAVVNDTLTVFIKDNQKQTLYLTGHNYNQLFFTTVIHMESPIRKIKFLLKDVPRGLMQLTLTDSLNRPFAERTFFAHYDKRTPVSITTDKNEYTPRQKVNIKIKLSDNIPDSGLVSVACVQANRIEIKKKSDIESYLYLRHDLEEMPVRETYLNDTEADKNFLENILLIKGWSRYTWMDMLKATPADTARNNEDMVFKGSVTSFHKSLNRPVVINISSPTKIISTDQKGNFILNNVDMILADNRKIKLMINDNKRMNYYINITDPYDTINKKIAGNLKITDYFSEMQENTRYMELPDNEKSIHLKEVKIRGEIDQSLYNTGSSIVKPAANYYYFYDNGRELIMPDRNNNWYDGQSIDTEFGTKVLKKRIVAMPSLIQRGNPIEISGIYKAQEFYREDYSKDSLSTPEYISTLFWKHQLKVSSGKETELSFYTSDITGRFKIVVQGITGNDVTYGETTFNVTKPR